MSGLSAAQEALQTRATSFGGCRRATRPELVSVAITATGGGECSLMLFPYSVFRGKLPPAEASWNLPAHDISMCLFVEKNMTPVYTFEEDAVLSLRNEENN